MKQLRFYYGLFLLLGVLASCNHAQDRLDIITIMMETVISNQIDLLSKFEESKEEMARVKEGLASLNEKEEESKEEMARVKEGLASLNEKEEDCRAELNNTSIELSDAIATGIDNLLTSSTQMKLMEFLKRKEGEKRIVTGANCKELLDKGMKQSGVYEITPEGICDGVDVYCDQETDGGGWTVILQRKRQCRQVDFARTFEEYAEGFGDPYGEIWIGNRVMHSMTGDENVTLRVEAKNLEGESRTGIWETFSVGSEDTLFTLSASDYSASSTLGNGLGGSGRYSPNQMKFSSFDKDNDKSSKSCSSSHGKGGWWFNDCFSATPTGPLGDTNADTNVVWWDWETTGTESVGTVISEIQFKLRPERK